VKKLYLGRLIKVQNSELAILLFQELI